MRITIKAEAAAVLVELSKFIEARNTKGSGRRFVLKFLQEINNTLSKYNQHPLCKYPEFANRDWRCFFLRNWVIAYKNESSSIEVKTIIHGSLLNY